MKNDVIRAWHILATDRKLRYGDNREVIDGETLSCLERTKPPALCSYGMHASVKIRDAMSYAPGPVFTLVEISGDISIGDDKLVGRNRKVLWSCGAKEGLTLIVAYAKWCAERAKKHAYAAYAAHAAYAAAANAAAADAANAAAADAAAYAAYAAYAAAAYAAAANAAAADAANAAAADAAAAAAADAAAAAERQEQELWLLAELRKLGAPV